MCRRSVGFFFGSQSYHKLHLVDVLAGASFIIYMGNGASRRAERDDLLFFSAAHGDEAQLAELIAQDGNVNHKATEQEFDGATPPIAAVQDNALGCLRLRSGHWHRRATMAQACHNGTGTHGRHYCNHTWRSIQFSFTFRFPSIECVSQLKQPLVFLHDRRGKIM